jgi:hypothetical protein
MPSTPGRLQISILAECSPTSISTCSWRATGPGVGRRSPLRSPGPPMRARSRPCPGSAASAPAPTLRRGMEQIRRHNSLHKAGVHIRDCQRAPRAGVFVKADEASPGPAATGSGAQWSISPNRGQAPPVLLCGCFSFMVCRYLFHLFAENRCHWSRYWESLLIA